MAGPITIVGLGPGDPGARTIAAERALAAAPRIVLRTAVHPGIAAIAADPRTIACDDLYESLPSFDAIYAAVVDRVLAAAEAGPVAYAVPGHPDLGEATVRLLRERTAAAGIPVVAVPAVSALEAIAAALGVDLLAEEAQIVDATSLQAILDAEPYAAGRLGLDPTRPCLVGQVYSAELASAVKLALGRQYPEEHSVRVVTGAGVPGQERIIACPLHALDRQAVDHLTSVWLPALPELAATRSEATFARIIARLRAPGGCPWDREQTHASLRDALIEEAYEAVDAIDAGDLENLAEELGDLLTHVYLHAQIAEEAGDFAIEDVFEGVARKLIRRHPHVFGDAQARTAGEVLRNWDAIKGEERRAKGQTRAEGPLARLPRAMPVLTRAARLLRGRASPPPAASIPAERNGAIDLGDELLVVVARIVAAGDDPEALLDAALRRRYAPVAAEPIGTTPAKETTVP